MNTGESWVLEHVTDSELLSGLTSIVCNERRATARVVAHLAEIERRRLHLQCGYSSLFDYCLRRLALSEGEAFRRVAAARLARRFPIIFDLVADGELHLSALCQLRDHLTDDNHQELLAEASRKTKKQVEELLARRFPRPDVASAIRKLPAPRQVREETWSVPAPAPTVPAAPPATVQLTAPATAAPARIEPVREERYRLQLNASAELKRKLELARDLMSHANPSGDLGTVVERALELLIDKLQRERFARSERGRAAADAAPDRRHVSNGTRRAVVERDGLQCSYVSPDGVRCSSRRFLQFHHEHAWAKGGPSVTANVRVLCAAHNRFFAERDFSREHVARAIGRARARERSPAR